MSAMGSEHRHKAYKLQNKMKQHQQQHSAGAKVTSANNVSAKVTDYRKVI